MPGPTRPGGSWVDQVFFDRVGQPQSSTPVDTIVFNGSLDAGQSYTQSDLIAAPGTVGPYVVRVVTDSNHGAEELSFSNNTRTGPTFAVEASYHATVSTAVTTVPNGTPVLLTGTAAYVGTGQPARPRAGGH